jgi:putative ABC transport system ATP-binding protein
MISLKNIHKSYQAGPHRLEVLKGIDLQVESGELVAIMGSSGSGKSTLLNVLGILDEYETGEYYLENKLMKGLSQREAARFRNQSLGFVFQSFNLLPFKTAWENVALPLYYRKIKRKERREIAMEYLEMMGLTDWADHLPNQLSGGQQQRVAIARAIVNEPKVILADEPTGALDSVTSLEVMEIFKKVNEKGKTIIVVTHERDIAHMTGRIIRLKDGKIENGNV